jgi:hypothetical protein
MTDPFKFQPLDDLAALGVPMPEPIEITPRRKFSTFAELVEAAMASPGKMLTIDAADDLEPELAKQMIVDFIAPPQTLDFSTEGLVAEEGINPKDALGMKKPDMSVVPPSSILHLASAMMDGANKYGPFNWRGNKVLARIYVAAAMRHLMQYLDGEDVDPTSGVHHLGHAMACCAILLDARETGNLADNRPTPGAAGDMIRRWGENTKFG